MDLCFSKVVVISGSETLAEFICAALRQPGVYVPLFDSPEGFNDDFGVLHNACIRISNAVRRLQPEILILAGCSDAVKEKFFQLSQDMRTMILDTFDENRLSKVTGYRDSGNRWQITEYNAETPPTGNLLVVEKRLDLSVVIARNLAIATHVKLVFIEPLTKEEAKISADHFHTWGTAKHTLERQDAQNKLFDLLRSKLGRITAVDMDSVSFISRGIPFGALPFNCPTTHYFSFRGQLGLNVVRGMMKTALGTLRVPMAVLCDPATTGSSEFFAIRDILGKRSGYVLRNAYKKRATAYEVGLLTEYAPCDFIIYSSHAGEQKGERVTERFKTVNGKEHHVCYDRVVSFAPTFEDDMLHVNVFKRWISIDGEPWPSEETAAIPHLVEAMRYYIEHMRRDEHKPDIVKSVDVGPIKSSDAFGMSDFNFVPSIHELGAHKYPFVFSNACSSWREMVSRFSSAGASVYIGTTLDIPNPIATEVAPRLVGKVAAGKTAGYALFLAQKEFIPQLGYTPYLMHGFIFTRLPPVQPFKDNIYRVLSALRVELQVWKKTFENPRKEEGGSVKQMKAAVEFLKREYEYVSNLLK